MCRLYAVLLAVLPLATAAADPVDVSRIHGKIRFVASFPDYKIKIVESFPDFRIQLVESFPDFTIRYVESFPGPQ